MAHKLFLLNLFILPFLFATCNSLEPPPEDEPTLNLTLEDASCIEAWIKLTTTNVQLPIAITLKQSATGGDQIIKTINLNKTDTLLYIDSLLPNQTYSFQASIQPSNNTGEVKSNVLSVTTLDTTSHDFTWQTWTFGEHSHSRLNDVAIIDENNIWAVGEIYLNDSLGQPDPHAYNAVHWDGNEWELIKVPTLAWNSDSIFWSDPLKTVWTFDKNNIWVTTRGQVINYNGVNWTKHEFLFTNINDTTFGGINKFWSKEVNSLWGVGNKTNVWFYNGQSWVKTNSGAGVDLLDIWGNEGAVIWSCGYSSNYSITSLLRNTGNGWEKVYEGSGNNQSNGHYIGPISGVWGTGTFRIYMMNWGGIYIQANSNVLFLEREIAKFSDVGFGIDGTGHNNIVACGEGFVGHLNGISYVEYPELYKEFRTFKNVSIKGNTVCAAGSDYNGFIFSEAVIVIGKQN